MLEKTLGPKALARPDAGRVSEPDLILDAFEFEGVEEANAEPELTCGEISDEENEKSVMGVVAPEAGKDKVVPLSIPPAKDLSESAGDRLNVDGKVSALGRRGETIDPEGAASSLSCTIAEAASTGG